MKQAFDFFINYPGDPARYQAKLAELQRAPSNDFGSRYKSFLDKLPERLPRPTRCSVPPRTEMVVGKSAILSVLDFFDGEGCRNVKLCFGMDQCHDLHLMASGSFRVPDGQSPQPDDVDRPYAKTVTVQGKKQIRRRYYLDFGKTIAKKTTATYLNRYQTAIAPQALHGYAIDIATLRHFLQDTDCLGHAASIRFRFGMNSSGNSGINLENARVMLIAISDASDSPGPCTLYLCDSAVKNDSDPTLCPPRKPCNVL